MSIEVGSHFKAILKIIVSRCESEHQMHSYEFLQLLKCLSAFERSLLAKYFCKLDWNIGSLRVLGCLQDLRILTAAEFISSSNDVEQIQLILNDFLETEYQLICNLFARSYYDTVNNIKLTTILDECIRRLFNDLLKNSNLNTLNYLQAVKETLPAELLTKIAHKHIGIALELHSSSLKEAFCNFSKWINEGVDDIKFTKDLHEKLISGCEQESLAQLFKLSTMEHFREWKFYLIVLQTIASLCTAESTTFIKKFMKTRLQQIIACPSSASMLHLLLTARASNATTVDVHKNIDAYANWYKQNIGEMKYVMSAEAFKTVLQLLEQCVDFEMETDYLEVHIAIAISPPVLCGKLVQGYKSKCRAHLAQLKRKLKAVDLSKTIVIDDSD